MFSLLTAAFLSAAAAAPADTLKLPSATLTGPYAATSVYAIDSLNQKGDKLDPKAVLNDNKALALNVATVTATHNAGQQLAPQQNRPTLYTLRFNVDATKFAKAKLNINSPANYKLFVNNEEKSAGELTFAPGRTTFALTCLVDTAKRDSLNITLTGEKLDALSFAAADAPQLYTMATMMLGEHYSSVSLSPSGKYLLTYYYNTKADGSNDYRTTLTETATGRYLMQLDGYVSRHWLPRRDVLYFTRNGSSGRELVTYDPATNSEKVIARRLPEGNFTMSPTEDYLIYTKHEAGKEETNGLKHLNQPDDRMPGWRSRSSLFRYDIATGIYQRLTYGAHSVYLNDISSDGKQLLLSFSSFDARRAPFDRTTLVRMNAATAEVDTLLADTAWIGGAKFSPEADRLLIKASPGAFNRLGAEVKPGQTPQAFDYRLYLYDINTRQTTALLPGFAPSVARYAWHAASKAIYFTADEGCNHTLFRLNPESKEVTRYNLPVSYVQGYTIASEMKQPIAVVFGQTGERARDMYRISLSKATPKAERIGEIDFDEMKRGWKIGTTHDWAFKASRGDSIKGFYILPPDFDNTRKHPLIVYYYGGCTPTQKLLEFQYPLQVLAAQGYIIYVCQPSGAIGFGQEFAARHVGTWGRESADDIIEGTRAFLQQHPWADAEKVGCMGASYGGFMTQYLQTRTDLFAAAVSHAGISNIASYWGGGYWGYSYGEVAQYGQYPWNNPRLYTEQSPLFHADKIHTPLLLLHGTADTNVPTNESQQLYNALKILGREVSYVQINGENHVITNYKKRLAWQNVIFAWFAKHLKGEKLWWETLYPEDK